MMTALLVFLCLPLSLSLTVPDTFFSPPSFSFLCSLSSAPSFLPSPPSPFVSCLHKPEERSDSGDSRTHHSPSLNGNPPSVCLLVSGGGSHDSCTLDRGQKRITVSEIKAGKDNTHAQAHLPPISLSPTQTLSPSWHIWGLSQWTQKFKATTSFCVFLIVFSEWFIRLCQTLSPRWKELQGW